MLMVAALAGLTLLWSGRLFSRTIS